MKILLTGADGNFGCEFQKQVTESSNIHVQPMGRHDWAHIDEKMPDTDVVVHAASDLRTSASVAPGRLLQSNLMSTATLLEATRQHGVKRLIFLSSCAVYGEDMRCGEDSLCCPITINGISKHLNEKLIAEFCSANGIGYQILRIFNSYGGNDRFSIFSKLKRSLQSGTPFTLNNDGRMQRDFIHVADVASVVLGLAGADSTHTHINVGTGVATKISTVVEMVTKQFPQLVIQRGLTQEAEYSRADTNRLSGLWAGEFVRIENYIENTFASYVTADDLATRS